MEVPRVHGCVPILCLLLLSLGHIITVYSQADVQVELIIPRWAARGSAVRLTCKHDVPHTLLYKVEFLRFGTKIFQYVRERKPPFRNFTTPGATLNMTMANESTIVLQDVDFSTSGIYSCEVSMETPIYTKASYDHELTIIQPQKHLPRITFAAPLYTVGELLQANCTSAPAHPAPHISWLINGKKVDEMMYRSYSYRVPISYRSAGKRRSHRYKQLKSNPVPLLQHLTGNSSTERPPHGCSLKEAQARGEIDEKLHRPYPSLHHKQNQAQTSPSTTQLTVAVSELHIAAGGRLELTCLSTIPGYVGLKEKFADVKKYTVTVDIVLTDMLEVTPTEEPPKSSSFMRQHCGFLVALTIIAEIVLQRSL